MYSGVPIRVKVLPTVNLASPMSQSFPNLAEIELQQIGYQIYRSSQSLITKRATSGESHARTTTPGKPPTRGNLETSKPKNLKTSRILERTQKSEKQKFDNLKT
jgi:hypothetical protein